MSSETEPLLREDNTTQYSHTQSTHQRLRQWCYIIFNLELAMALHSFAFGINGVIVTNLYIQKACRLVLFIPWFYWVFLLQGEPELLQHSVWQHCALWGGAEQGAGCGIHTRAVQHLPQLYTSVIFSKLLYLTITSLPVYSHPCYWPPGQITMAGSPSWSYPV